MSESETKGRCWREIAAAYEGTSLTANRVDWILADAIDRLAADVAAVKEAAVPARAMSDVFEKLLAAANHEREEAIRERDEARAEFRRLLGELAEAIKARDDANAASVKLMEERNAAVTRRDERDKLKALVDELKAACDQWRALAWDQSEVKDAARAESDELRAELDEARAEAERLKAELAAAQAETQRIQDEADDREQTEKVKRLNAEIEKTHRTLLNRTWERDIATAEIERLREACVLTNILDRAGSPPVVEVPAMTREVGDANTHMGQYMRGRQDAAVSYRDALDRAGIPWREVPRE